MNSLVSHIEYLLNFNDCVVVPGWGAFIIQRVASNVGKNGFCTAPRYNLTFNPDINHNDGLLAVSISRKDGISYDMALSIIEKWVDATTALLSKEKEVSFGTLGHFEMADGKKLFYANNTASSYVSSDCFGLKDVHIGTLKNVQEANINSAKKSNITYIAFKKVANYAASVAILLCMMVALSTPNSLNLSDSEKASLDLLKRQNRLIEQVETKMGELLIAMPPVNSITTIENKSESNLEKYNNSKKFYLVVASLPSIADANKFIQESNDDSLSVVEMSGKFRVYVSSADDCQTLYTLKHAEPISKRYPDAWVCKNK